VGVEGRTADRDEVIRRLAGDGIGTSVHFRPLHLHPYYRDSLSADPADYPVATAAFDRILSLPLFPSITEDQIDRVAAALEASLG
jgi:dTDP-4-amino-4,6-dideoxygalactose transaminase